MPSLPAAVELLKDLSRVLRERRIPWYLFGAQAVALYGLPRMTGQSDLLASFEAVARETER